MSTPSDSPEAKGHRVVRFPIRPVVLIDQEPFERFQVRFESAEAAARQRVTRTLEEADRWADRPDSWYLSTISDQEPRGVFSCACPIHPFKVRYYSPFDWSLDDPWRLYCPHCREEGRAYDYYPNPRYPDDGSGCFPTDEVWREDHDKAWSKAHDGIPWDRWDGEAHGYMEPTNAYYFKGLCWLNAYRTLSGSVLHRLGEAYQFALKLHTDASAAERYAHKAQVIQVTLSRAFLGDAYLAAVLGTSAEEYAQRLSAFYERGTDAGTYPGYRLFTPTDHMAGDPRRPLDAPGNRYSTRGATLFPGAWNWKASQADDLMIGFSLISESFTDDQRRLGLRDIALRIATSAEGDSHKVADAGLRLKRGVMEYTLHPYTLVTGGDNLSRSTQMPRLALGRILEEDEIAENVARDIVYFIHNFFTGDGLGREGSPSYTSWSISGVMAACHGLRGAFDQEAPYYDPALGGLNLLSMPIFKRALGNYLYTGFPNGRPISWEDCVIRAGMPLEVLHQVESLGGGIPEEYRQYLQFESDGEEGPAVQLRLPMVLPSRLLGQNRKGVLRSGDGVNARALSIDFTERVGHYHMAPLNLTLFAKGHELATDLGYLGSTHFMTVDWIKTFPAHNTVAIRSADGDPMGTDNLRGDLRYFKDLPGVKAMDAAEQDAVELSKIPGTDRYQRTVAMIDVDAEDAYVVDLFRVNGGHTHDWTFHGNGHRFDLDGVSLTAHPNPEVSLYEHSGFTFTPGRRTPRAGARWGSERVHNIRSGQSSGSWTATWGDVTEFPNQEGPPEVDRDVFLKLHMVDEAGSEVVVGRGPAQRWLDNRDIGEEMSIVTVRRKAGDDLDTFVAVHEPYRSAPFVSQIRRLPVTSEDDHAVALSVSHRAGTDLILSADGISGLPQVQHAEQDGMLLESDGELAVAGFDGGGLRHLSVIGGTYTKAGGRRIEATPTVEGALVAFDDVAKSVTIRPDGDAVQIDTLPGEALTIRHRERASAYTIESAEHLTDGTLQINLEGWPHLAIGYLLVKEVETDRVWVEPPPVLQGKVSHLNLYRVGPDRGLALLEPLGDVGGDEILDEWGTSIRRRHYLKLARTDQLTPGDEIAYSPLHPGVDRIRIVGSAHWRR
jgi:hypothetical protein